MIIASIGPLRNNRIDFGPTYGFILKKFISKNTQVDSILFRISLYTLDSVLWIDYKLKGTIRI